ncbi:hypothetical protein EDC94DRAFT_584668 [Helicostylum pulchrum]|nr:hypothetical protein EDC94DRAFT_584668 [Helicostylum pulchrum]
MRQKREKGPYFTDFVGEMVKIYLLIYFVSFFGEETKEGGLLTFAEPMIIVFVLTKMSFMLIHDTLNGFLKKATASTNLSYGIHCLLAVLMEKFMANNIIGYIRKHLHRYRIMEKDDFQQLYA